MCKLSCYSIALTAALLSGCSSLTPKATTQAPAPVKPVVYTPGELNAETLFDLLSAELAGHQQQYDISLDKYLKQAELTGDPGILRRATRIAQFTQNQEALEKAALLWNKYEPHSPEPQELLAGLFIHQQKFDQALPYVKATLENSSAQVLLLLSSQVSQMTPEENKAFLTVINAELVKDNTRSELWLTKGIIERHLTQNTQALKSFESAIRTNTDAYEARIQKADLLKELGRYNEALKTIDRILLDDSENRQARILQIQTLYKANKSRKAIQLSHTLIDDYPEETQLQLYLALLALDFNYLEESRIMLEKIANDSADSSPNFYLGLIAEQSEKYEAAIQYFSKVRHGNNIVAAYTRILSILSGKNNQARVAAIMDQAIQQNADLEADLIHLHADWLNSADLKSDALALLKKGVALFPDVIKLRFARAMLYPQEEFALAEADFKDVLFAEPDNAMALNAYGYTLTLYTTRYKEAYDLIKKAIAIKPEDPAIMDSMGWVLYKLDRYKDAHFYLLKAYKAYPDPEVGGHLIAVLVALKEKEKAQKLYDSLISKYPDSEHLTSAGKLLNGDL